MGLDLFETTGFNVAESVKIDPIDPIFRWKSS